MNDIKDISMDALVSWLEDNNIASYRAGQILRWVYQRQADSFEIMTDLKKDIRMLLSSHFSICRLEKARVETSHDSTKKYLFRLTDGNYIESVLIPERNHYTLCISSQVGCAQGCRFCLTAKGGFVRNLTTGEILAQVRDIRHELDNPEKLTNIVFMGMGEPMANYKNVVSAANTLTNNTSGFNFSARRITVSSAGLADALLRFGYDTSVNIAVSLNATDNETRDMLMPVNRKYPIEQLLEACKNFNLRPGRRITFEYILIHKINDTEADAKRLAKLLSNIKAKINLIPFNTYEGCPFERPTDNSILQFQNILFDKGYTAIIRQSKGSDISAACGQLRGKHENFII